MTTEASLFGLTHKKAMVIGGGQGVGESTSHFLARAGCDVAVIDLERAERVAGLVGKLGRRGVPIVGAVAWGSCWTSQPGSGTRSFVASCAISSCARGRWRRR